MNTENSKMFTFLDKYWPYISVLFLVMNIPRSKRRKKKFR